jgi:hypothetical protein
MVPQASGRPAPQASDHIVPQVLGHIVPRRRTLLASAALPLLLAAAGCQSSDVFAGPDPLAGRPPLGHDVLTLQAVITAEEHLIGLYRTAIGADHVTASRSRTLSSLLSQHEQHLAQLKARLIIPPGATPSPSQPTAGGSAGASAGGSASASAGGSAGGSAATMPPALAQLFASIAASDATHVTVLGG